MARTPPRDIKMGDTIAGRYEVRGAVGRGGMGRIYKVFDKVLGEEVALKTLLPDHVEDKVVLERFFNEARIARSLSHPNIIRVHDIGQAESTVYISMELLKGKSLRQMLDQLQPGQRLPIAGILRMFDALCAALDYAHHFTVHRDIKPENVMILTDGSVKLMDFGISKLMGNLNLTSASIVMGTPHYMAPEQLRNTSTVDARADIYSVGVMLYEVLTGDRPTGLAKPASTIRGEVPAALDPVIEKCCQPDANKRYQKAGELRAELRRVRIDIEQKSSSGTSGDSVPPRRAAARGGLGRIALVVLSIAAIGGIAYAGLRWAEERRARLLASAPTGLAALPPPAPGETDISARDFARLAERMPAIRGEADAAALDYSEEQRVELIDDILERGNELWAAAEQVAGSDPGAALELGWDAASCYLAVSDWRAEMVFVLPAPPGASRARGFFLDVAPITIGQFREFCETENWAWPTGDGVYDSPLDYPMSGAAYFDAVAYLARQSPPRRLPTREELARAFTDAADRNRIRSHGQRTDAAESDAENVPAGDASESPATVVRVAYRDISMPGEANNVESWFEWTAPTDLGGGDTPTFGDDVFTVGGRLTASNLFFPAEPQPWRYEWSHSNLGFRGKVDLPRSIDELVSRF